MQQSRSVGMCLLQLYSMVCVFMRNASNIMLETVSHVVLQTIMVHKSLATCSAN